jgi:hypothetical protein
VYIDKPAFTRAASRLPPPPDAWTAAPPMLEPAAAEALIDASTLRVAPLGGTLPPDDADFPPDELPARFADLAAALRALPPEPVPPTVPPVGALPLPGAAVAAAAAPALRGGAAIQAAAGAAGGAAAAAPPQGPLVPTAPAAPASGGPASSAAPVPPAAAANVSPPGPGSPGAPATAAAVPAAALAPARPFVIQMGRQPAALGKASGRRKLSAVEDQLDAFRWEGGGVKAAAGARRLCVLGLPALLLLAALPHSRTAVGAAQGRPPRTPPPRAPPPACPQARRLARGVRRGGRQEVAPLPALQPQRHTRGLG